MDEDKRKKELEALQRELEVGSAAMRNTLVRIKSFSIGVALASPIVFLMSEAEVAFSTLVSAMAFGMSVACIHYFFDYYGSKRE